MEDNNGTGLKSPPTSSGKALELLVRQRSFMGFVNDKLNLEAFQVPGRGTYNAQERDNDDSDDGLSTSYTANAVMLDVPAGSGKGKRAQHHTIKFRLALVVVVVTLVCVVCAIIALPSIRLSKFLSDETYEECLQDFNGLNDNITSIVSDLALKDMTGTLRTFNTEANAWIFTPILEGVWSVAEALDFGQFLVPGFTGDAAYSNTNGQVSWNWNGSVGPAMTNIIFRPGYDYMEYLFATWQNNAGLQIGREMVSLCNTSSQCISYGYDEIPPTLNASSQLQVGPDLLANISVSANGTTSWQFFANGTTFSTNHLLYSQPFCTGEDCATVGAFVNTSSVNCFVNKSLQAQRTLYEQERLLNRSPDLTDTRLFMIFNGLQNAPAKGAGLIFGSSDMCSGDTNSTMYQAVDYPDSIIQRSSVYVRDKLFGGSFLYTDTFLEFSGLVNLDSLENCSLPNTMPYFHVSDSCYFLSVRSMTSGSNISASSQLLQTQSGNVMAHQDRIRPKSINDVQLISVLVYPGSLYLDTIEAQMQAKVAEREQERKETDDKWTSLVTRLGLLSIALIVAVSLFAVWFSYRFGRSILQLSRSMTKLESQLVFEKIEPQSFSHIAEINRMQKAYNAMCETIRVLAKFVPSSVVRNIVENKDGKGRRLHVVRKNCTIMFSDIKGFTTISEALDQKQLLLLLTKYLSVMTRVIESYGGVVGEILGDGILAFWNTPDDVTDHQVKACACALAQQQTMELLNNEFKDMLKHIGVDKLAIRIGLHTSKVLTGNIGSQWKMKFGCIGDGVNLASRLEGICKLYGVQVLVSENTYHALPKDLFVTRELDLVCVKGKTKPVALYEVIALKERLSGRQQDSTASSPSSSSRNGLARAPIPATGSDIGNKRKRISLSLKQSLSFFPSSIGKGSMNSRSSSSSKDQGTPSNNGNDTISTSIAEEHGGALDELHGPVEFVETYRQQEVHLYEDALHAYQRGDFREALETLTKITTLDPAGEFLRVRIEQAIKDHGDHFPSDQDIAEHAQWDGVLTLDGKDF